MSLTPSTPSFNIKSFWSRPEGKTGALVLVAGVVGGVYGLSLLLPWAILFATDMIHLGILVGALFGSLYVVTNKTFRSIVSNMFQMSMRWTTSLLVAIDPIAILKNNLDKMRDQNEQLSKGLEGCSGAKRQLENSIATNNAAISKSLSMASQSDIMANRESDNLKKQSLLLHKQTYLQDVGRRQKSNANLQKILDQTTRMYTMLTRWQNLAEYNIENTDAEIKNAQEERNSILASYRALGPAQRLIKGDPDQLKMVNQSLEYLAEDNANKLGAMEDFSRYSEKFLSGMDIEQGANAADAEKMLTQYESKLMSAGAAHADATAIPASKASNPIDGDYLDILK